MGSPSNKQMSQEERPRNILQIWHLQGHKKWCARKSAELGPGIADAVPSKIYLHRYEEDNFQYPVAIVQWVDLREAFWEGLIVPSCYVCCARVQGRRYIGC